MNTYRHGDITLHPIKEVEGTIINHNGSFALALGGATGHHHRINVKDPADMEIRQAAAGYILVLKEEGSLTHEEHGTLTVAPGKYRVGREREKDYFSGAVRRVID